MPRPFRFGVVVSHAQSHSAWVATVRRIEKLGYSSVLIPDRPSIGGIAPFPALAVAAEATTSLRVGSYVFCNDYRHPVLLAREAATLDLLSEGRFELGLGAGVGPAEFQQLGIPFESGGTRLGHLAETIQLLKQLFTEETVNFNGKYYKITAMGGYPRPVQKPHMPILVAGIGERMLKLAGREADIVAIGARITRQGLDPTDAPLEQKIAWVKEAAGPRFADMELSQTIYDIQITDSGAEAAAPGGGPPIPKRPLSTEQAIAELIERRDRYGFSYLQVFEGQMENFAPVVAGLAGK
ncbi:MAG TPA: TIGR03621 family F420-dependent LLM class oxidoreductase [Ktedonobacteraceae bacterium]|nr:TIGR03621 family F420-dependent LLM class oxidoreductase [Ktedonobacteraceae bacterium]